MQTSESEIDKLEEGVSNTNESTDVPQWLRKIVVRIQQSHLTITIDKLGQLAISDTLKGFLIEIIKLAGKDQYSAPNSQFLQDLKKLDAKEITEIRSVVDVVLGQPSMIQYVQHQFVFPPPPAVALQITFDRSFGLPPRFANFTGRETELTLLENNVEKQLVITQKIAGTGGIGKSQLAATFAYQMLERFTQTDGKTGCRSVIWFIASTDEGIDSQGLMTEQLFDLGIQLGFDPKQLDLKDLIRLIYQRLQDEHGPFLVVFDNAQDFRNIKPYLPPSTVPVIVTTRNNNERDFQQFKTIALTIFSEAEALAYIHKVLSVNHSDLYQEEKAKALARALGYFPLALTQALAYIATENILIAVYLEEFITQKAQYLKHPLPQDDNFQEEKNPSEKKYESLPREEYDSLKATVWAVIQLSLKKVAQKDAQKILLVCACLAPEAPIDEKLLGYWTLTTQECRQAVAALRRYSLLENVSNQDFSGHVSIHALVQEILRLSTNDKYLKSSLYIIAYHLQLHYVDKQSPRVDEQRQKILLPHCQRLFVHLEGLKVNDTSFTKMKADLYVCLGNNYLQVGNPSEAVQCYQRALEMQEETFGSDDSMISKTLVNLGNAINLLGKATEAKAIYERALAIEEHTYGSDHSAVANVLSGLGTVIRELGDPKRAKTLLKRALIIKERTYGSESLEVAIILTNLGNAVFQLGDTKKARALYERALAIDEQIYGPDHINVTAALENLGSVILNLGDANRAKELMLRALAIQERTYGPDHPSVAKTLTNLGDVCIDLYNLLEAKAHLERALFIKERVYGREHREVATTLRSLGSATIQLGDAKGAKVLLQQALIIQEQTIGSEHFEVAKTLNKLAIAIFNLGDAKEAKAILERALVIRERVFGVEHSFLAANLVDLGNALLTLGNLREAKIIFERALKIQEKSHGSEHIYVADTLVNLSLAIKELGDLAGALALYKRALLTQERFYGPEHSRVASTLVNIGVVTQELGDITEAIIIFERALSIQERLNGLEHFEVAIILIYLGNADLELGNASKAKALLERALLIKERHFGPSHPEVAETLQILGKANLSLGDAASAKFVLERALDTHIDKFGENCLTTAISHRNLGIALAELEEVDAALMHFKQCAEVLSNYYADEHQNIQEIKKIISALESNNLRNAAMTNKANNERQQLDKSESTSSSDEQNSPTLDDALQQVSSEILFIFLDTLLTKYSQLKISSTQLPKLVRACAQNNDASGLKLLIQLKVPCDEPGPTTGQTALHLAVIKGHLECVKLLMAAKADPNKKDAKCQTPLSLSANNPEITRVLIVNELHETSATAQTYH